MQILPLKSRSKIFLIRSMEEIVKSTSSCRQHDEKQIIHHSRSQRLYLSLFLFAEVKKAAPSGAGDALYFHILFFLVCKLQRVKFHGSRASRVLGSCDEKSQKGCAPSLVHFLVCSVDIVSSCPLHSIVIPR